jgi:hypothetical protein
MDLKETLARVFQELRDDSAAAAALGVETADGYAILGAEHDDNGRLLTACVDVPILIAKIAEGIERADHEYEALVRETLEGRAKVNFRVFADTDRVSITAANGLPREYLGRCAGVSQDPELGEGVEGMLICLLTRGHPGTCDLTPLKIGGMPVCGAWYRSAEHLLPISYCRLAAEHRPEPHHGRAPGGGVYRW